MIELLETYSLSQVIVFFIIFCLAIKEAVTFYDWAKTRIQQCYNKNLKEKVQYTSKTTMFILTE